MELPRPTLARQLTIFVLCLLLGNPASADDRPNVIFFAVDDLCDWVGAMGYEQAITPNMDSLARQGVLFTNAHAPGVYCAPSRTAIFTGRYASTTGCYATEIYHYDHPDMVPLQMAFHRSGYATFGGGKLFHHREGFLDRRGWDEFFVRNDTLKNKGWRIETWPMAEDERDVPFPDPFPASIYNRGKQVTGGLLCDLKPVKDLEGQSLASVLATPHLAKDRDVFLPYHDPGGYAVINQDWRYIHYSDHTEELYNVRRDPHEWNNLASGPDYAVIKEELKASAPKSFAPPATDRKRLRLVIDGKDFHWQLKKKPNAKPDRSCVNPSTLKDKVMVGYQGWFNCQGDGARLGWKHWARRSNRPFGPGNVTVDLWPDVSELEPDERYATGFTLADGSAAEVFSSANRKTVLRHFRWMQEYGIDGAFVQRFASPLSNPKRLQNVDTVLSHVRQAATRSGRTFAVMYDLSGMKAGQVHGVMGTVWISCPSSILVSVGTIFMVASSTRYHDSKVNFFGHR